MKRNFLVRNTNVVRVSLHLILSYFCYQITSYKVDLKGHLITCRVWYEKGPVYLHRCDSIPTLRTRIEFHRIRV